MRKNIIIGLLAVAVIGIGFWGFNQYKQKQAVMIETENNYQHAYQDLAYYVDKIHDKMGTALATKSVKTTNPELADVWRLSALAHGSVGQLPLTFMPFNETEQFLSDIGQFSYQHAIKNQNHPETVSDETYQQMEKLYKQSGEIENSLRTVQNQIMENHSRWRDVKKLSANNLGKNDSIIVDGMKSLDQRVGQYTKDWGPELNRAQMSGKLDHLNKLPGKLFTANAAADVVEKQLKVKSDARTSVRPLGKGAGFKGYAVNVKQSADQAGIDAAVSKKGGVLIYFIKHREIKEQKLSLYQGIQKADRILAERGFKNMTLVKSDQYQNTGVLTYVKTENGVRFYPKALRIKIALDNGEVMAFDQTDYLVNRNMKVNLHEPALSKTEALKAINSRIKGEEAYQAVYQNENNENILCYEILGTKDHDTYRIFINADTGEEEKVQLLK